MFQQTKAWQSYRQVATQTASPGQLVLQLYTGILRFLEQSRLGFSMEDPKESMEAINNNLLRAQAIIQEMDQSLNLEPARRGHDEHLVVTFEAQHLAVGREKRSGTARRPVDGLRSRGIQSSG